MEKIRNFDCRCYGRRKENSLLGTRSCSHKLSPEVMYNIRLDSLAAEREWQDMRIIGHLEASRRTSEITTSTKKLPKKRKCARTTYCIGGTDVCRNTFLFLMGICKSTLTDIIKHSEENGARPRLRKKNSKPQSPVWFINSEHINRVVEFIKNYAEDHSIMLPGRHPGHKDYRHVKLLPTHVSKASVWRLYTKSAKELGERAVCRTSFIALWNQLLPHIRSCRPHTDLCWQCQSNNDLLIRSANLPDDRKSAAVKKQHDHLALVQKERALYNELTAACKKTCADTKVSFGPSPPASKNIRMHYSFDLAQQQIKSPSSPVQSDQLMAADEPLVWSEQMISPEVQSVLASSDGQIPPVSSDGHILLISSDGQTHAEAPVSGIKEENAVHGYEECSQYETRLEYIVTSAADIKLEQIQTPLVSSDDQRLLEAPVSEDEDGDDDEYEEYSHPDVTLTKVDVMIIKVKYQDIKKYIKICEPCLDMFMTEVRVKFSINEDKTLIVTDDGGMEVDADVFPELVTKDMCLVIHDSDEESPIPEFSSSLTDTCSLPSSQDSGTTLSLCKRACLEEDVLQCAPARELVKKVLLEKPGGAAIMKEYEDTGSLCDSSRRQMVNILAAHMTETEGRIPQRLTKEKYALGVITLFPYLKDPFSKKGYEHFYDAQSGTGFIAWRLKTIQRKTKLRPPSSGSPKADGGPTVARNISQDQLQDEACEEAISLMTHTNDRETIFQKMQETFQYRQRLIHNPATSAKVLSVFPRLLDTKGLVLQDFSLLVGSETSARLLERWPSFKPKLIKEGAALVQTPLLQRLLLSAREEQVEPSADNLQGWDSDMSTLLLLLHILSPQAAGRKRSHKISASRAIDNLVVFHKSCQSLDEHLNEDERRQPYLLASGTSKRAINNFYIAMDKKLIPCQGNTSLAAFDELFKTS
ncbi:uncharacterized protein LOC121718821 isoform X3 [Alosa sapidissima]|uniref:uncharacterized protein LOC121718821 isoform X3 n=1 Tax=Alosa sapidissima TaxID=34773 RepID=UPI001C0828D7|nr:uncharacterized protein LOC121718821 isoform X3 [Alosa sapidissima]